MITARLHNTSLNASVGGIYRAVDLIFQCREWICVALDASLVCYLRTLFSYIVLYGCATWSATFREELSLRVFENGVLRRIFGPRRDEVTGEWREIHKEKLNGLYHSPNTVRLIKSRRMRWAGHVARMGDSRAVYRVLWGNMKGRDHLGDADLDGRIILRWILRTWDVG